MMRRNPRVETRIGTEIETEIATETTAVEAVEVETAIAEEIAATEIGTEIGTEIEIVVDPEVEVVNVVVNVNAVKKDALNVVVSVKQSVIAKKKKMRLLVASPSEMFFLRILESLYKMPSSGCMPSTQPWRVEV